ncbi:MAG TPA: DUF6391 domain-containing protein [Anaerolineales bacterium]|nr:DUF6391 domain-containing protein [Anaerolineales bacterium]
MILDLPFLLETRRNHAVEHATLHILARKYKNTSMGGHSNPTGFYLMGNFTKDDILTAAAEAMDRLRAGESELAIHEGCGTNIATSTLLPAFFAFLPMSRTRSLFWRFMIIPFAIVLAVFGYFLSRPLGPWLQRNVTTEADLGGMRIVEIKHVRKGLHRVITK